MLLLLCFIFTLLNFLYRSQFAINSWYASCYACCAFCFDLRVLSLFCRREIIVLTIWRWGRTWTIATVTVAAVTRWARRRRTWRCARVTFITIVNRLLLDFGEIQRGWITFQRDFELWNLSICDARRLHLKNFRHWSGLLFVLHFDDRSVGMAMSLSVRWSWLFWSVFDCVLWHRHEVNSLHMMRVRLIVFVKVDFTCITVELAFFVRQHVSVQISSSWERLIANVALERRIRAGIVLELAVRFHVSTEIAALCESLFADFTFVGFLCRCQKWICCLKNCIQNMPNRFTHPAYASWDAPSSWTAAKRFSCRWDTAHRPAILFVCHCELSRSLYSASCPWAAQHAHHWRLSWSSDLKHLLRQAFPEISWHQWHHRSTMCWCWWVLLALCRPSHPWDSTLRVDSNWIAAMASKWELSQLVRWFRCQLTAISTSNRSTRAALRAFSGAIASQTVLSRSDTEWSVARGNVDDCWRRTRTRRSTTTKGFAMFVLWKRPKGSPICYCFCIVSLQVRIESICVVWHALSADWDDWI